MLLFVGNIVIFSNCSEELQEGLNLMADYCNRWKLKVNVDQTKAMVIRKVGTLPGNLSFYYNGQ